MERLLPPARCIELMEEALVALAEGRVVQPLRSIVAPPGAPGLMVWMPSYRSGAESAFAVKALCIVPGNPARGLDAHQGAVLVFDGETGELRALVDASAVTAIRTAAVSALATRVLARDDARVLAIVGAGVQARTHLDAIACVRPLERVRIASRTFERARALAADAGPRHAFPVEAVESVEEAVRGADLVVTATSSAEPVLERAWLGPGTHVNTIGMAVPGIGELDTETVAAATLFVDRRESVENEASEYRRALEQGAIAPGHIRAELAEVLLGAPGRTSDNEVTLFRSLGLAAEDLFAAQEVVSRAREEKDADTTFIL